MIYLGVGKTSESKVLIAVNSCSSYKINGFGILHRHKKSDHKIGFKDINQHLTQLS